MGLVKLSLNKMDNDSAAGAAKEKKKKKRKQQQYHYEKYLKTYCIIESNRGK
jgi:hypothetical protein